MPLDTTEPLVYLFPLLAAVDEVRTCCYRPTTTTGVAGLDIMFPEIQWFVHVGGASTND